LSNPLPVTVKSVPQTQAEVGETEVIWGPLEEQSVKAMPREDEFAASPNWLSFTLMLKPYFPFELGRGHLMKVPEGYTRTEG